MGNADSPPALAVFAEVYRFIVLAGVKRFHLWPSVVRELNTAAGLAPLLYCSLRAPSFARVIAVDASELGQGVVAVNCDDTPSAAIRLPISRYSPGDSLPVDISAFLAHAQPRWSRIVSAAWRVPGDHINVLEARAALTAIRWALKHRDAAGSNPPSLGFCRGYRRD